MSEKQDWKNWLWDVLSQQPKGNPYLCSPRGIEITNICLNYERDDFNWHRSDADTFWLDVQLFTKYALSDEEILMILRSQPGCDNFKEHSAERNAYAELKRGLDKLRKLNTEVAK